MMMMMMVVIVMISHKGFTWFVSRIEELHLSLNGFLSVEYAVDCAFPRVTSLHMNGNSISRWAEMESLGKVFPGLANLVMMDMPMCELTGERPDANFCCLKSLNLGNTNLSSWTELEKLKSFPCLTDVKVHGIPFLEASQDILLGRHRPITR